VTAASAWPVPPPPTTSEHCGASVTGTPDPLDLIREAARHQHEAQKARDEARDQLHEAIREAYKTGTLTHTQIGDLLGVTKQRVAIIIHNGK